MFLFLKSASNSKPTDFISELISGCLSEQAGRHPLSGDVCTNLQNHGLDKCQGDSNSGEKNPREYQYSRRFLFKKRQGNSNWNEKLK